MALTYDTLVNAIQDYSENTFAKIDIDLIITRTEQFLHNATNLVPFMKHSSTLQLTASNPFLVLPIDLLSIQSFAINTTAGTFALIPKEQSYIREAYPLATTLGQPKYYAFYNQSPVLATQYQLQILLGPTPNQTYPVELHYFAYPESIVTANVTWIGNNFDFALLNGCLWEAAIYMKQESDILQALKSKFDESVAMLKNLGEGKQEGDVFRNSQARMSVR